MYLTVPEQVKTDDWLLGHVPVEAETIHTLVVVELEMEPQSVMETQNWVTLEMVPM